MIVVPYTVVSELNHAIARYEKCGETARIGIIESDGTNWYFEVNNGKVRFELSFDTPIAKVSDKMQIEFDPE